MAGIGPNVRLYSLEHLSERKLKFCEEYLKNGRDGKEAARSAGYASKREADLTIAAYRNLHDKHVVKYLDKRITKMEKIVQLDLDYKNKKLKKIIDVGIPDDADMLDPEMAKLAISAIQEHNKMVGDIAPTRSATLTCDVELDQFILEVSNQALKEY